MDRVYSEKTDVWAFGITWSGFVDCAELVHSYESLQSCVPSVSAGLLMIMFTYSSSLEILLRDDVYPDKDAVVVAALVG